MITRVEEALGKTELDRELWDTLGEAEQIVAYAESVKHLSERKLLKLLDADSESSRGLKKFQRAYGKLRKAFDQAAERTGPWREGQKLANGKPRPPWPRHAPWRAPSSAS